MYTIGEYVEYYFAGYSYFGKIVHKTPGRYSIQNSKNTNLTHFVYPLDVIRKLADYEVLMPLVCHL